MEDLFSIFERILVNKEELTILPFERRKRVQKTKENEFWPSGLFRVCVHHCVGCGAVMLSQLIGISSASLFLSFPFPSFSRVGGFTSLGASKLPRETTTRAMEQKTGFFGVNTALQSVPSTAGSIAAAGSSASAAASSTSSSSVREHVQVCVRTRPSANYADKNLTISPDAGTIDVFVPKAPNQTINNQLERWAFKFDNVLHNVTQQVHGKRASTQRAAHTHTAAAGAVGGWPSDR